MPSLRVTRQPRNGLTVPVTVYVGGQEIGTVSPSATQDWALASCAVVSAPTLDRAFAR